MTAKKQTAQDIGVVPVEDGSVHAGQILSQAPQLISYVLAGLQHLYLCIGHDIAFQENGLFPVPVPGIIQSRVLVVRQVFHIQPESEALRWWMGGTGRKSDVYLPLSPVPRRVIGKSKLVHGQDIAAHLPLFRFIGIFLFFHRPFYVYFHSRQIRRQRFILPVFPCQAEETQRKHHAQK